MGFFRNNMNGVFSWNSNFEKVGEKIKVFSIHGGGEYLLIPKALYEQEPSVSFIERAYILNGLLWNKKWNKAVEIENDGDLLKELLNYNIPQSPQEKLDNLFEYLFRLQTVDGEQFEMDEFWQDEYNSNSLFFKNRNECNFYLKVLKEKGLIKGEFGKSKENDRLWHGNITFDGFEYYNKITNEGLKSKNCFIAMSFSPDMTPIRNAIKSSCIQTNFIPILIDEIHADADKTINDEIISNIKKSKFCIADFTEQKDGVYFEAGFALGRGLKVIYTCQRTDFKDSHFDTNHFPHIIYNDVAELEEKLINKIEAWIKD